MTKNSPNSPLSNDSARCRHRSPSGRRCRLSVLHASSPFCFRHAQLQQQKRDLADLAADLTGGLAQFTSPSDINKLLSNLFLLLSQNRISPRCAAVLAYISHLLLRTLPAVKPSDQPQQIILLHHIPRPEKRPVPESPSDEDFPQPS